MRRGWHASSTIFEVFLPSTHCESAAGGLVQQHVPQTRPPLPTNARVRFAQLVRVLLLLLSSLSTTLSSTMKYSDIFLFSFLAVSVNSSSLYDEPLVALRERFPASLGVGSRETQRTSNQSGRQRRDYDDHDNGSDEDGDSPTSNIEKREPQNLQAGQQGARQGQQAGQQAGQETGDQGTQATQPDDTGSGPSPAQRPTPSRPKQTGETEEGGEEPPTEQETPAPSDGEGGSTDCDECNRTPKSPEVNVPNSADSGGTGRPKTLGLSGGPSATTMATVTSISSIAQVLPSQTQHPDDNGAIGGHAGVAQVAAAVAMAGVAAMGA